MFISKPSRCVFVSQSTALRLWLVLLLPVVAFAADPPLKTFRVFYVPPAVTARDFRIDDRGDVFAVNSIAVGQTANKTEFFIYRPAREGNHNPGVQKIPGPVTPNMGQYSIIDINQKSQFICSESSPGFDHRFAWTGSAYVELEDPRSLAKPELKGFSNDVFPTSIHDDGSIWGVAQSLVVNGPEAFGGVVSWNLSGTPTVRFAFRSDDDPLRTGGPRNELGQMLRFTQAGGQIVGSYYWEGVSTATGTTIDHPPSTIPRLNDHNQVAGIVAASQEVWLHLPDPAYGLTAGFHILSGILANPTAGLAFNNSGQIIVGSKTGGYRLWQQGQWYVVQLNDPAIPGLVISGLQDVNAFGALLAFVRDQDAPPGPSKLAVLTPEDLAVTIDVVPSQVAVGEQFDLRLTIRNNLDISLNQVGILVPSMYLTGALVVDWVKAPAALLKLAPGASGTLHYGFRATGLGKLQVHFQVQGLDIGGQPAALTESLATPELTVAPALDLGLTPDRRNVELDEEVEITAVVHNASAVDLITDLQLVPPVPTAEGTGKVEFKSGPLPPLVSSLAAGARQETKFRFKAKEAGTVEFQGAVKGKRPEGSDTTSLITTSRVVRIGITGDLLINRLEDPISMLGLDDVYQDVPNGAQSRTNVINGVGVSTYLVFIDNDSKVPRNYRLTAFEGITEGWEVAYQFKGADITAAIRSGTGFELPELAAGERTGFVLAMTLTNSRPADPKRITIALSSPHAPGETLDAVEAVAVAPEVDIMGIEVTQVVQDWRNSVPLVADKETLVRVFPQLPPGSSLDRPVRARLRGYRGGVELPESPLSSREPSTDVLPEVAGFRKDFDGSLNFELPASWTQGYVGFRLDPLDFKAHYREPAEPGGQGNDGVVGVTFVAIPDFPLVVHRVIERLNSGGFALAPVDQTTMAVRRIKTLLPIGKVDWHFGFSPTIAAKEIPNVGSFSKVNALLKADASFLQCPTLAGCAIHQAILPYRVETPTDVGHSGGGRADAIPSSVSTARLSYDQESAFSPSHELGHVLGRHHAILAELGTVPIEGIPYYHGFCKEYAGLEAPDFPYFEPETGDRHPVLGPLREGEDRKVFGFDSLRKRIMDPIFSFELMGYCNEKWISKFTYEELMTAISARFGVGGAPRPQAPGGPVLQMVVRGLIDLGQDTAELQPLRTLVTSQSSVMPGPGPYRLELFGPGATVLDAHDFVPETDVEELESASLFFVIHQPADLRGIRLKHGEKVLLSRTASAHVPTVHVTSPNGGEALTSADVTVRWEGADADGEPLTYAVEFSSDGGSNWTALAVDFPDTELTVPRSLLRGTQNGLIRVQVSDGFLVGTDSSDGSFQVADNSPEIFIASPDGGDSIAQGERLYFEAAVMDAEDGTIPGGNVKWSSNLDGPLGTGSTFDRPAAGLQLGTHLISLTASDAAGHTTTATTSLTIVKHRPARLGIGTVTDDGKLELELRTSAGSTNVIETSPNLKDWTPVLTRVPVMNTDVFPLPLLPGASRVFIRVQTD